MRVLIMVLCRGGKREVMSLLERADVLNALEKAMSNAAVGCHYSANGWTVRKSEYKVNGSTEATVISEATRSCESSYCLLKKVERALCLRLEDETQDRLSSVGLL